MTLLTLAGCGGAGSDRPPGAVGTAGATASGARAVVRLDLARGIPSAWERRRATVEHGSGTPGSWVRLDATGTPAYLSVPPSELPPRAHRFVLAGRFRVRSRAVAQSVGLATVENSAGEHHADLFVDRTSGRCRVDLFQADTAMSRGRCDDHRWHRVTLAGDFGGTTYTLTWSVDGVAMPPIRSAAQPRARVHRLWLGDATPAKTNSTDWADVTLEVR